MNPVSEQPKLDKHEKTGGADKLSALLTPSKAAAYLPLLLVFTLALVVRIIGLSWGLPNSERWYSYHPDESTRQIVGAVVNLLQGDFNPHFFNYPSLSIYATWIIYQFMLVLGLTTNVASTTYPWPVLHDIILAGRIFSVFCGAGTAVVATLMARELGMRRAALLAGLLVAFLPGLVQHSHFATVDVPATFFALCCLYFTLKANNFRGLVWAAVFAGLAAGTKYNVGLVAVAPLLALWFLPVSAGRRVGISLGLVALTSVVFFVTTPYALLDFPSFWGDANGNGFYFEAFVHPKIGSGDVFQNTGNGWIYHATFNLPFVMTWPLVIGALAGLGFAAKQRVWWPLFLFAGLFFFSLGFSQVRFMRYLFPIAPVLAILAAHGASRLPFQKVGATALLFFALWGTKDVLWPFISVDPRDLAAQEMKTPGEKVGLANAPWFYTPPFQPQGLNTPVAGVTITGYDAQKLSAAKLDSFAISEYEFREQVRINPFSPASRFLSALETEFARADKALGRGTSHFYQTKIPLALPGRDFVPHDYLYTNPETRLYWFGWSRAKKTP